MNNLPKFIIIILIASALIIGGAFYLRSQEGPFRLNQQLIPIPEQTAKIATPSATAKNGDIKVAVQVESTASGSPRGEAGKIKGKITVTNTSSKNLVNLYYDVLLRTPETQSTKTVDGQQQTFMSQELMSYLESKDSFQLNSGEKKALPFELEYTPHLKSDDYTLIATVITDMGDHLGTTPPQKVSLNGAGDLITFNSDSCKVIISNKEENPAFAPIVQKGGLAEGKCIFTNNSNQPLSLKYNIKYAILNVLAYPKSKKLTNTSTQEISFTANETKEIRFPLPTDLDPQVYEAYISFIDSAGKSQSPINTFRWTIPGISGRIGGISLDRDYYANGQIAKVTATAAPSMDLFWGRVGTAFKNPKLSVSLSNGTNQLCGQLAHALPANFSKPENLTLDIPVTKDCLNPQVSIKLLDGDQEVANENTKVITSDSTLKSLKKSPVQLLSFLIGVPIIFLILLIIWLIKKKGKRVNPPMALFIFVFLTAIFALFYFGSKNIIYACCPVNSAYSQARTSPGPVEFIADDVTDPDGNNPGSVDILGTFYGSISWSGNTATVSLWGDITELAFWCANRHEWWKIEGPGISGVLNTTQQVGNTPWSTSFTYDSPTGPTDLTYTLVLHNEAWIASGDSDVQNCVLNDCHNRMGDNHGVLTFITPICSDIGGSCANGSQITASGQFCSTRQSSYDVGCSGSYPYCYTGCSAGLSASCSASPPTQSPNVNVVWTGAPTGGYTGTPAYSWDSSQTAITQATNTSNPGNVSSFSKQYATDGSRTAKVTITAGTQTAFNTCSVSISSAFINTTSGDVHSNTGINTPGGP